MADGEYILLETKAFDEFISQKENILTRFNDIQEDFDNIKNELLKDWKGKGAEAFEKDAKVVSKNIGGIYDILKIMCDTLTDCREVFEQCDRKLHDYNQNPKGSQ